MAYVSQIVMRQKLIFRQIQPAKGK